jgi:hypothetical protein
VQDERQAFGRGQGVEDHQQRESDRVGHERLAFGVGVACRLGPLLADRLLAPGLTRAQQVQAHPGYDRGEPAAHVLDAFGAGPAEPQPGLLHSIVRLGGRAEHPMSHRVQAGPVRLEALRQPVTFVHSPPSLRDPS